MTSETRSMVGIDPSVLGTVSNVLLIFGVVAVYQSGIAAGYTLGLLALIAGVIGTILSLLLKGTHPLKLFEQITVIGMFIGILGMLQSWDIKLYEYGFVVLGICTLAFIVIIHIPIPDSE